MQRLLLCVLFGVLLPAASPAADAPPHTVIRPARAIPSHIAPPRGPEIVRSRLVEVDLGPLAHRRSSRGVATAVALRIHLDLFDRAVFRVRLDSVHHGGGGGEVFEGAIEGTPGGTVVLAVKDGQIFGNVKSGAQWYQIRSVGEGLHAVVEMDASALPPGAEPLEADGEATALDAVAADDGSMIDLLVMYTPSAKTAAGGDAGIVNLVNTAIAETNTAYQNSGVTQRVRLVHMAETANWMSNGNVVNADNFSHSTALDMLRNTSDGAMDAAHSLRNTYGADAVALIVNNGSACGIAYIMQSHQVSATFASLAFSVTHWSCATGNYSFAHELGHNMGLAHDRANAGQPGAFSYAYGWQDPTSAFRTVMAYNCNPSCPRVQHFSNPNVNYNGLPTGSPLGTVTEAHGAQALNNTRVTFSNFRASVVPACSYVISPGSVTAGAGASSGTVTVTAATGCDWSASSNTGFLSVTGGAAGSGNGVVSYSIALNSGAERTGTLTIGGQTFTVVQAPAAPANLVATATSPSQIDLTWSVVSGATSYQIWRRSPGGAFVQISTSGIASYSDGPVTGGNAYAYHVRTAGATTSSSPSNVDLALAAEFTDDPLLMTSTAIRALHLAELRAAVQSVRQVAGLPLPPYTDDAVAGTTVRAVHLTELRSQLDEALLQIGISPAAYTDAVPLGLQVRAIHFQEIRDRLK